jgi:DNA primase
MKRITNKTMESIKKIDLTEIADILGIKKGDKNYHCFSSSHVNGDKNPSLSITNGKGFKCWSCSVSGSTAIGLVMQNKNMIVKEAVNWLADTFDLKEDVEKEFTTPREITKKDIEIYNKFISLCGFIDDKHWAYIKKRHLSKLTLQYGVTSVKEDTQKHLKDLFSMEELVHSGVFTVSKRTSEPYFSFFAHTLLFPFYFEDEIVYIQGRTIEKLSYKRDGKMKQQVPWHNLPKNIPVPYNVNILLHSDIGGEEVLICEGTIDTLSLLDAGYNAIGLIGVDGFNVKWLRYFEKYDAIPVVALDNDISGDKGAEKLVTYFRKSLKRLTPKNGDWNASI